MLFYFKLMLKSVRIIEITCLYLTALYCIFKRLILLTQLRIIVAAFDLQSKFLLKDQFHMLRKYHYMQLFTS